MKRIIPTVLVCSQFWSLGRPRSRFRKILFLMRALFLFTNGHLFTVFSYGWDRKGSNFSLLIRTLILSWEYHPFDLITSKRPHVKLHHIGGLEFQDTNFGAKQTQYIISIILLDIQHSKNTCKLFFNWRTCLKEYKPKLSWILKFSNVSIQYNSPY